jgi:vancomycin resistance protein YoaR
MIIHFSFNKNIIFLALGGLICLSLIIFSSFMYYVFRYSGRIFPRVHIAHVQVASMTKSEATQAVQKAINDYKHEWPLTFKFEGQTFEVSFPEKSIVYLVDKSVDESYLFGRQLSLYGLSELVRSSRQTTQFELATAIDESWMAMTAASIAAQVDIPPIPTHLEIHEKPNGEKYAVSIQGQKGLIFDQRRWINEIRSSLQTLASPNTELTLNEQTSNVTEEQAMSAVLRANNILSTHLVLSLDPEDSNAQSWILQGIDLVKFIRFDGGYDKLLITDYVVGVAQSVNRPPRDAKFQFDETNSKVKEFVPAEDGVEVQVEKTVDLIAESLQKLGQKETIEPLLISVQSKSPTIGLGEVNRLGIKERIGVGVSTYKGSILSRVHNVELAAGRLNGTLIKPGEEFSFNAAVGEVSAATGYESAYIIRDGRTQLGDGGGLCQDSTTVFRAALDSGLPITYRRGHSYRVGYYEQNAKPGLDATVYSPSTDLKFVNDTPAHILIQTEVDSPNRMLKVIFYGTSDGRKATIKDQAVWDITPAPPDVFQDDPTLPIGTQKQIDWKAAGAKAKFTYVVERAGQVILEKTFLTTYQPWAAVYLRGTKQ